jgi:HAMP domain-containing protein
MTTSPTTARAGERGAIKMGLLLGLAIAMLVAGIVGAIGYTTNQEVTDIFDRSAHDSRELAVDNVSRFTNLLASNTAVTVLPSVLDHNYSYIRSVLRDMTRSDRDLLYVAVYDADGELIEESGGRADASTAMSATAPIETGGSEVGKVELLYSTSAVDSRIRQAQEENRDLRATSLRKLFIGGGVVLAVSLLLAVLFGMWLSRPVTRLARAAGELGEGKFEVRVDVGGPSELRQLATTFNSMAGQLEASIQASIDQAALEREVATARRLQRDMMPPEGAISIRDLELAAWYAPAGKMGGDWWTLSEPDGDGPVTILIGDVIGHGIPAALFTAAAKSAHRTARKLGPGDGPEQVLATIDDSLRSFARSRTMSCCALHIDLEARELALSIGAHPAPLLFRGDSMEVLEGDGPLLGDPEPATDFTSHRHDLEPGDLIALFTDGIVEATDDRGRMFGLRRLSSTIAANAGEELDKVLGTLKQAFFRYIKDEEVDDDVTVVLVRYAPKGGRAAS